jgi:hypothetical protein
MEGGLIYVDLIRTVKDMLYLCIERMYGLTNGCRNLERIFCRLVSMNLACSRRKFGDNLNERED